MVLENAEELELNNMTLQLEISVQPFLYFGPLPEGHLKHVGDETWCNGFQIASKVAEEATSNDPGVRFGQGPDDIIPNLCLEATDMISKTTKLDPAARATIGEAMERPWWGKVPH